jgi:two-component system sensor histidine kinase/response regulator
MQQDAMNHPQKFPTIVVIDDDPVMRLACSKILTKAGYAIETFEDGAKGLEGVVHAEPDLVLVDLKMPGISGIEVISRVHDVDPQIVIIVITGYATISTAVEAMQSGAYDYLPKPFSPDELRVIVNRGMERRGLIKESQRLEMERELLKRRFFTFVSHQLQSPLAAVHQYLEVMKALGDSNNAAIKRREWLDRCLERTVEMLAITKDWLSLSKVESGSLCGERARVDVKRIILNILRAFEGMASEKNISLSVDLPEPAYYVIGDRSCLNMLFDNLVSNAIKYNKLYGEVRVSGERQEDRIVISVADTGIGIADEAKKLVFREFYRVKGRGRQATTGTGLGLAICRTITEELNGSIDVESKLNIGSTFKASFPLYREA